MIKIILFSFFSVSLFANSELSKIPVDDYNTLEIFFDYLIHNTTIGYTLCGKKPVAIDTFPSLAKIPPQYAVKILTEYQGYSTLWRGLETWHYYSDRFPSNNFVFMFLEDFDTLVLINKKTTTDVIEQNLELFQNCLGHRLTVNDILSHICDYSKKQYIIASDQILLGILLGYGKNNSTAFSNRSYIQKLEGFKLYDSDDSLNEYLNPGFMIINNGTNEKENKIIKKNYRKGKHCIHKFFKKGEYFKTFIELYTT